MAQPSCRAVLTVCSARKRSIATGVFLVEQNVHLLSKNGCRRFEASGRKIGYCLYLLPRQPVVEFDEFVDSEAIFRILEQGRNRHSGVFEHPCAVYLSRYAFDSRALRL